MKSWEFLPIRDHIEEGIEELRIYLRDRPNLLKETTDYDKITDFLNLHLSNSEKPIIGNPYIPVQVTSQSFAASLLIRTTEKTGILIKIDELNKACTFNYNGKIEKFPKGERKAEDITQWGLLYNNKADADQFLDMVHLSFGEWDIKITKI